MVKAQYRVRTSFGGHPWQYSEPMTYAEAVEWTKAPTGSRMTVRIRREIVPAEPQTDGEPTNGGGAVL